MDKLSCKILVVDDDRFLRRFCSDVLNAAGYQADTAVDGLDALEKLKKDDYDAVLTDVKMPGLDGIGLYGLAARKYPVLSKRFVFMTGSVSEGLSATLARSGQRAIVKPFGVTELLNQMQRLVLEDLDGTVAEEGSFCAAGMR